MKITQELIQKHRETYGNEGFADMLDGILKIESRAARLEHEMNLKKLKWLQSMAWVDNIKQKSTLSVVKYGRNVK